MKRLAAEAIGRGDLSKPVKTDGAYECGFLAQSAEARLGAVLDAMPDACVIVDGDGRIVRVNTQTERLFGYDREELLGRPVELLLPERFRGSHVRHRASYQSAPRPRPMGAHLDLYARRKDGSEFPVDVSLSPLETAEGALVIGAIRDVTVRKQAEQALEQSNRELERSNAELAQFASVVSHDLRSPLSAIAGFGELLERHYADHLDAKAARYLTGIMDGARHMQTLIDDVLAYAQVGAQAPPPEPIDCTVVVERALANLQTVIAERGAMVTHADLPAVTADATQLSEVFQNLIGNAIKYCRDTPRIAVSAQREGAAWLFSVRDNGIGMDAADAERIFDLFQRAHPATEYPGTGIGLAICKKTIERHGGRIWAESCLGQGTTFKFTLPAREDRA
jgi:PAS domain S-box-containing protein